MSESRSRAATTRDKERERDVTQRITAGTLDHSITRRDPSVFWAEQAHHRLRRVKQAVDPDNLIRSNHPVR
jgi:hypothetical protein